MSCGLIIKYQRFSLCLYLWLKWRIIIQHRQGHTTTNLEPFAIYMRRQHDSNISTMQTFAGSLRKKGKQSYMLSLALCACEAQNIEFWGIIEIAFF